MEQNSIESLYFLYSNILDSKNSQQFLQNNHNCMITNSRWFTQKIKNLARSIHMCSWWILLKICLCWIYLIHKVKSKQAWHKEWSSWALGMSLAHSRCVSLSYYYYYYVAWKLFKRFNCSLTEYTYSSTDGYTRINMWI